MSGNVGEWCWDWFGSYTSYAKTNPMGASSGANRVIRGGDWNSPAIIASSVYRYFGDPGARVNTIGFRIVRP